MKDYEVMVAWFGKYENFHYVILGWETYLFHKNLFIFLLCIAHPICVYGDDQIICYPGADDVTGEPRDA